MSWQWTVISGVTVLALGILGGYIWARNEPTCCGPPSAEEDDDDPKTWIQPRQGRRV